MKNQTKSYNVNQIYIYNPNWTDNNTEYMLMYLTKEENGIKEFEKIFANENIDISNAYLYDNFGSFNTHYSFSNFIEDNDIDLRKEYISYEELKNIWPDIKKEIILGNYNLTETEKTKKLII